MCELYYLDKDTKPVFVRLDTLEFGPYDAMFCFNDCVAKKCDVLHTLDVRSRSNTHTQSR